MGADPSHTGLEKNRGLGVCAAEGESGQRRQVGAFSLAPKPCQGVQTWPHTRVGRGRQAHYAAIGPGSPLSFDS
jgi:hypothetical protein